MQIISKPIIIEDKYYLTEINRNIKLIKTVLDKNKTYYLKVKYKLKTSV